MKKLLPVLVFFATVPAQTLAKDPNRLVFSGSTGTGFSITANGHLLTNHHVVKECARVAVHRADTSKWVRVVASDGRMDLALLKSPLTPRHVFTISAKDAEITDTIYAAGFPLGRGILSSTVKVTKGIVSSLAGIRDDTSQIQIDAAIQGGNSGGPVLDISGNVVAVVVSGLNKELSVQRAKNLNALPENINFAIKASVVRIFLNANSINIPTRQKPVVSQARPRKSFLGGSGGGSTAFTAKGSAPGNFLAGKKAKSAPPVGRRAQTPNTLAEKIRGGTYLLSCWITAADRQRRKAEKETRKAKN